jgi:ABC-type transport system involved in multi-copper enzyme maturation permease subunit
MQRVINTELYKIFHNKITYLIWFAMLFYAFITVKYLPSSFDYGTTGNALIHSALSVSKLFIIVIVAASATYDAMNKTSKNIIASGISRTHIYFGRLIAYIIVALISLILSMIFFGIIGTVLNGYGKVFDLNELLIILESFGLQAIYLMCVVSVGTFFSAIFRSEAVTIALNYLVTGFDALIFIGMNYFLHIDLTAYSLGAILKHITNLSLTPAIYFHFGIVFIILVVVLSIFGDMIYHHKNF